MERAFLVASTFCFLLGFSYTMYALGAGTYRPSRFNFTVIFAGFVFQTAFLYQRGHAMGHCPLTNFFEVIIFLNWSMVLLYLAIGTAYRLSLLGAFTSPLVFLFQSLALILPIDVPAKVKPAMSSWLELHAALSVISFGAFAMAGVAGAMYLAQEHQLKTHRLRTIFFHLPPIADLAVALNRLLLAGFVLLTAGLLAGFMIGSPTVKVAWGVAMWLIYGGILQAEKLRKLSPRRIALLSVIAFSLAISTLWGLNFLKPPMPY